jgi:hypothetical protein
MKFTIRTVLHNNKTTLLSIFFIMVASAVYPQALHRVFTFQTGDEYQKQIRLNSNCTIQRGKQKLDIVSSSVLTKSYKVTGITDTAYDFSVTIEKMEDKINSLGRELYYNSESSTDTTSQIKKALKYLVGRSSRATINRHGIILSATDVASVFANDTLFAFTGVPEEPLVKGARFSLIADFSTGKAIKKGYVWDTSLPGKKQSMTTHFVIDNITDAVTVIKFTSVVKGQYLNSNTNGTYVLDNKSGIIIQRLVESVSTGYEIQNKKIYATTRRISLSEECIKKK